MTLAEFEERLVASRVYRLVVLPFGDGAVVTLVASTFREEEPVSATGSNFEVAAGHLFARLGEPSGTLQCRACVAASFGEELTGNALARARALGALCDEHDGVVQEEGGE